MDFRGELLMYFKELEGERHMSPSWSWSDFDHYRCPSLFRSSEPADGKSQEQS